MDEVLPVGVMTVPLDSDDCVLGVVTMFGLLDLRLDPNVRFLNREFIRSMCFVRKLRLRRDISPLGPFVSWRLPGFLCNYFGSYARLDA